MEYEKQLMKIAIKSALLHVSRIASGVKLMCKRCLKLIELNQMRPDGLTVFNQRKDQTGYSSAHRNVTLIKKYEDKIKINPNIWEFFNQLPPSYKRDSIWWVMSAKKEETRLRRLNRLIATWEERTINP